MQITPGRVQLVEANAPSQRSCNCGRGEQLLIPTDVMFHEEIH